ncbi:MAG: hypothetical protein K6G89_05710 [Clostridia bacterium]|nr:hypothetical protein [Clostridia bacterium]
MIFDESGNAVFKLTAEYMKDAKGECSDRVAMTLDETEDGFLIAVSADAEWINEEGREFPVRIDPTISISNPDTDAYDAVWVSGNTRDYGLAVGTNTLTYVLFANDILSDLPTGATVSHTSATFDVNNQSATTFAGTCAVRAELISGNWSTAAVKQGGSLPSIQPSYAGLTDSCINSYSLASHGHFSFTLDLTEVLRKSFYRTDNGFMLGTECLSGSFPSKTVLALEALQITYSDHSGLNSYQSDHMISIDGSGTAYIKDINGKVSYIHPGISTKGAIVPVSVDMVFDLSFIGTATDAYYGKGWRPSIVQTMKSETITDINDVSKTFYVLTDGTGGKHYFAESNGTLYIAEENPFQTYNANLKTLSYGDGSIATFNAAGYMVEYRNSYGDYYTIAYDGSTGKINSVTDGSGVTIVFEYSQSGKLVGIEIENCSDRGISLLHTGDSLTRIGTASGENTGFAYLTNGEMYSFGYRKTLNETQDRVYVSFSYFPAWSNGDLSVAYAERFELQDNFTYSLCECVGLSFGANTIYSHYYGAVNTPFYTEYIYFDRNGRTVAVFDSLGNASGSEYAGGNISKMNLISGKTNSVMTDGNLIKDFSKKTSAWTTYTVAGSGNLYAEDDSSHFRSSKYGGEYFKLTSNSSTSEVYAKYSVPSAEPGKTYTLAVDIDPLSLIGTGGIVIGAMYSFYGTTLKKLSPVKYYEIDQRIQYSFEIPSAASPGSISVLIGVKNLSGDLFFDLVSLTEGACDRPVNMISDSGFYYGTSAWNVESSFSPAVVTSDRIRSIEIPGSIGEMRRVSQVLSSTVSDGNYLIVSGFGKGKAVSSGKFGIIVDFDDSSLTDRELLFSNNTAEWQYVTAIIAIPDTNGGSTVTIRLVNDYNYTDVCFGGVTVEYVNGIGEYINRSLYTYDETNGLPLTEKAFSGELTVYSYDQTIPNRVSSTVHTDVRKNVTTTEYSYNASSYEVVSTAESFKPNGSVQPTVQTTTNYVYNSNGNLTESVTFLANTSPASEVAHRLIDYSSNGRFLEKEADASGRFLLYSYSFAGDLLSVTDGDGNVTAYTYDSYGRLTGESCDGSSFGITYGSDSTEITRTSFSYSIDQNAAGNSTAFTILDSAGDPYRTLATYTYGGTFGHISKLTFGNGQEKYFGYDSLGNLKYIGFSPSDTEISAAYVWYYDLNGNVVSTLDRSDPTNLVTKWYSYDQEGNLDQILSSDGNTIYYRHSTTFDQRYESFTTAGTGRKYDSTISRSESERKLTADSSLGKRTVVYDDLGRITSFSYEALYSTITKSYSFINKNSTVTNDNQTYTLKNDTSLVSSETCSVSGVPTISYTYYDNGKIETILENGAQIKKYEYDALGQLVREDNKQLNGGNGYTIKYVYDNCGNILGKMVFSYSPNVSTNDLFFQATLVSFPIYGYDATFNDLLATYIGASLFSYDNAGNPLTYYGGKSYTMTWTGGNKLSTVTPQGNTYAQSYFYDADGLRTVKTLVSNANVSKKINYFWVGNTLRSEWADDGSYEIVYVYDAAGRICGFSYSQNGGNEVLYRYVRNAQGDVTHLVDINGAIVAAYTYDTWGKLISIKNGNGTDITNDASSIGYINPIRYRGYYYDNETGFYYLQSRYYDPVIGRFLNADSQLNLQDGVIGINFYCYCGNDPVNELDPTGRFGLSITAVCFIVGFVVGSIVGGVIAYKQAKEKGSEASDLVLETVAGALGGGIGGGLLGYFGGALISTATGILGWSITQYSVLTVKTITILGPMPLYIEVAENVNAGYYLISDPLWKQLSDTAKWYNNSQYILDAYGLGSSFMLVLPEFALKDGGEKGQWLLKEIRFLVDMMIPFEVG